MLEQVAERVHVHTSGFMQSNAVLVHGDGGALLVDPGITRDELDRLADDLSASDRSVVAGFPTHPHWDHLLWHARFGTAPRYATAACAAAVEALLANPRWQDRVAGVLPPDIAQDIPLELFGLVTGLPADADRVPWDGPGARVIEHRAHAAGHAALVIEEAGVLVAGDMLSDVLIPMLNHSAEDPIADYLAALLLLEDVADGVGVLVPGHGSVCAAEDVRVRIERDRAYVQALREGTDVRDPRIGPGAAAGWGWVGDLHAGQVQQLAARGNG